jgi:hypothetical protein
MISYSHNSPPFYPIVEYQLNRLNSMNCLKIREWLFILLPVAQVLIIIFSFPGLAR